MTGYALTFANAFCTAAAPWSICALIWGAIPATFGFALTVNTALLQLYPKLFGQDWSTHWAAGFIAPFTEESAKLCGLVLLLGLAPRLVRTANDGLIIGAFIGLGFATLEDFLYAANATTTDFGTNPSGNALSITASRLAAGFVSHPMFSALVCTGAIYVIGTAAQPRRIGRGIAFIGLGMILHFTWDDAGGLGRGNGAADIGVFLLSAIIGFTVLTIAFRAAAPTEQRFVRDVLGPEVATGVVTDEEVTADVDRHARKHYRKAAPDRQARRARKHLGQAILDLAHDIAAAKDAGTPAVEHSRSEVARLRANASDE